MTLTIALQSEMSAKIENGNIVIDIPDSCKRDLWDAQLEYWLEKDFPTYKNAKTDGGYLRVKRNKVIHSSHNY